MAEPLSSPDPIVGLTLRYLDGQMSEAEVQAFAESLRNDQDLVDRFVAICFQEQLVADIGAAALHDEAPDAEVSTSVMLEIIQRGRDARLREAASAAHLTAASGPPEPLPWQPQPHTEPLTLRRIIGISPWIVYGPVAAAILVLASVLVVTLATRSALQPPPNTIAEVQSPESPQPERAARLVRTHSAVWVGADGRPNTSPPGPLLAGTRLQLLSGVAEVEMDDGAYVYLQGATTVRFSSPSSLRLDQGRLTASVGQHATGFEVRTPQAQIIDMGTEFGVVVDDTGKERAEVFVGQVMLAKVYENQPAAQVMLSSGQGLMISPAGITQPILADDMGYVRPLEFEARVLADEGSGYHRWLAHTYQLRRDPSVTAFYVFDRIDVDRNRLVNHATGSMVAGDGVLGNGGDVSSPIWGEGRFEQTHSLGFGLDAAGLCRGVVVPDSDAIDFDREMTIAAWVRFDKPSTVWNTLLSKRDIPPANLNYQLSISGQWYDGQCQFQFGAGVDNEDVAGFDEPPFLERDNATGWQHVAVVSDGTTLRYYHNGELVHEREQPMLPLVNDAPLLIGTSSPELRPPLQGGLRPFRGAMSELLLARRAMTDHELKALYEAGRPENEHPTR